MRCDKCGFDNAEGVRFCGGCGAYQGEKFYNEAAPAENSKTRKKRPIVWIVAAVLAVVALIEGGYILLRQRAPAPTAEPTAITEPAAVISAEPTARPVITAAVGDIITLGTMEQDGDSANGAEAITWRVLVKEGDRALVISELVLDKMRYNDSRSFVTWETCGVRRWLNEDFLTGSFTAEERERIIEVTNKNEPNPEFMTPSGVDTRDRVFLLSTKEVWTYFKSMEDMAAKGTAVAAANGMEVSVYTGYGQWWLRTSGAGSQAAACVYRAEGVDAEGYWVDKDILGVRPAMWIALR